jgi:hypothetical protein
MGKWVGLSLAALLVACSKGDFKSVDGSLECDAPGSQVTTGEYRCKAGVEITYTCVDKGKSLNSPVKKVTQEKIVSVTTALTSGSVRVHLVIPPPAPTNFDCSPGQELLLVCATYSDIMVFDPSNSVIGYHMMGVSYMANNYKGCR